MSGAPQYLIALYIAEQEEAGPVASGDIADALGRSPAATTEMIQRLEQRGLVAHEPYDGATLTPDGRERAEKLYETYTTLSQFFDEVLELDDYEEEAMQLAGNISPVVAERLSSTILDGEPAEEASLPSWPETDRS